MTIEKPDFVAEEHLVYLDNLRESGTTNMFGAVPFIRARFHELSKQEASDILSYWMKTFGNENR